MGRKTDKNGMVVESNSPLCFADVCVLASKDKTYFVSGSLLDANWVFLLSR